tara:strand:+ start:2186 stop:2872 length:687 start_codon:yes stop_codon:yes gene_type:complete
MSIPNVNIVENNNENLCNCKNPIITTKTASQLCCKSNCSNCIGNNNLECRINKAKKICRIDNYKNAIQRIGQYPWMAQNLQWGNYPDYLKCFCQTCDKKVHDCCNCNCACNKLSKNIRKKINQKIGYFKVYNPYQDYTYNTVDGWPPLGAKPTGDSQHGHGVNTYIHLVRDLKSKKVIGYNKIYTNKILYKYRGQIYSEHVKIPVYDKKCNKYVMVQIPCVRGAVRMK